MIVLSRKQKAHVLIHNAAAVAAGVGAGWLAELWPIPDAVPLSVLQAGMVTALGALFVLQPVKSLLFGLLGAFAASLLGRGLALWLFSRLPEDEVAINVAVAAMLTEVLGWGTYRLLLSLRPRLGRPSLVVQALEATRHGPFRVLFCSAPMLAAVLGALLVFNVRHRAEIRLRAPLGSIPLVFEYPLIERLEGTLQLSGTPRGANERVYMPVRNNQLAAELDEKILVRPAPMVRMHALVPVGASRFHVIDRDWQVEVRPGSDYWERVRGRLYLLLLGLLGALAMLWLGQHRSRAI